MSDQPQKPQITRESIEAFRVGAYRCHHTTLSATAVREGLSEALPLLTAPLVAELETEQKLVPALEGRLGTRRGELEEARDKLERLTKSLEVISEAHYGAPGLREIAELTLANEKYRAAALDSSEPTEEGHAYLSTACRHGLHDRCRKTCKFCGTACLCSCHTEPSVDTGGGDRG